MRDIDLNQSCLPGSCLRCHVSHELAPMAWYEGKGIERVPNWDQVMKWSPNEEVKDWNGRSTSYFRYPFVVVLQVDGRRENLP